MIATEVIQKAQSLGVTLTLSDNQEVRYRGQRSAVQELLPLLRTHKTELIGLLTTVQNPTKPKPAPLEDGPPSGIIPTANWSPPMVVLFTFEEEELIRACLSFKGLTDAALINQIIEWCRQNSDIRVCFLELTKEEDFMAAPPISLLTGELIPFLRPLSPMTPKQEEVLRFFFSSVERLESDKTSKILDQCQKDFRTREYYLKLAITKTRQWEDQQSKKWGGHKNAYLKYIHHWVNMRHNRDSVCENSLLS